MLSWDVEHFVLDELELVVLDSGPGLRDSSNAGSSDGRRDCGGFHVEEVHFQRSLNPSRSTTRTHDQLVIRRTAGSRGFAADLGHAA